MSVRDDRGRNRMTVRAMTAARGKSAVTEQEEPAAMTAAEKEQEQDGTAIKYMEEISLNAWPSYKIELYDGWLIRYSSNYTYRTNAVEQIGLSTIPTAEKIEYCERVYSKLGTPVNFKINPLLDPDFDRMLGERGYEVRHVTEVMTCTICDLNLMQEEGRDYLFENRLNLPTLVRYGAGLTVQLRSVVTEEWMKGLFHLNGIADPRLRRIVPKMYAAIPKETIAASIEIDGRIVATGLGIRDREWVGIYAIYVSPSCWRRHYARAVCSTILTEAFRLGSTRAYLQVVKGNAPAKKLYESLGFRDFYTYWFRSRSV